MRALSLTQPWASAIALGIKQWETRSWPTKYRGEVCIHAAKSMPRWAKDFAKVESMAHCELDELPLGSVLCIATLAECRATSHIAASLSQQERNWGDYSEGRYAFKFTNVRRLALPVLARGALGLWLVSPDLWVAISKSLAEAEAEKI
jgi:activating signal cointegrator 1